MEPKKKVIGNSFVFRALLYMLKLKNKRFRIANIVMFHFGRCGSTVLAKTLEQNSNIAWGHEILQNIPFNKHLLHKSENKVSEIEGFIQARMYRSKSAYYGFDTKAMPELDLNQRCAGIELNELVQILTQNNFSHYLILKRNNYLRRTISVLVGMKRKKWHSESRTLLPTKVYIDLKNLHIIGTYHKPLLEHFGDIDMYYSNLYSLLREKNTLILSYEDDIQRDPAVAYKKVCSFIGCEPQKPDIQLKPTNPFSLKDLIENYDEVLNCLKDTKYYWMLEE